MGFQWGDIVVIKNTNSQLPLERGKKINITSSKIKKKRKHKNRQEGGRKKNAILDIRHKNITCQVTPLLKLP